MTQNKNNTRTRAGRNASEEQIKELETARQRAAMFENHFNIEKNAKNEAYSFILEKGLYDEFVKFSRENTGRDFHADCVNWFINASKEELV